MPEAPLYWTIRALLRSGGIIPFLGAGASFGARNPSKVPWRTVKDVNEGTWQVSYLPTASELATALASEIEFPEKTIELTTVSQYFTVMRGRTPLSSRLHDIFTFDQEPGALHHYLADAAGSKPLLIVTTNYDDLIERAFDQAGRPYDTVVHMTASANNGEILWKPYGKPAQELLSKDLDVDLAQVSVIYKIHGAIDRQSRARGQYIITEDDYVEFLARMTRNTAIPNIFAEPFQTRPFLFLGYGLTDWNLRVVLNRIEKELRRPGDIVSYAIETRPKPLEKKLWEKRGVIVYDRITLDAFMEKLKNAKPPGTARGAR
jgi:hypothetical protein